MLDPLAIPLCRALMAHLPREDVVTPGERLAPPRLYPGHPSDIDELSGTYHWLRAPSGMLSIWQWRHMAWWFGPNRGDPERMCADGWRYVERVEFPNV